MLKKFGKLITASFIVMAVGIITFLLVFPLYHFFRIDTDIIGLLIVILGIVLCLIGVIRRYRPHGWKLVLLIIVIVVLCLPLLSLIVSLVYYLFTGKPLGE
jgi:hypothetical protein